jgi:dimethylargininase
MAVGSHYYIGLSERTNADGARQIIEILQSCGLTGSVLPVGRGLHLKSSMSYLEEGHLLATGDFRSHPALAHLHQIRVDDEEQYAANSVWINGFVLVPAGYPKTERAIRSCGFETIPLDMSEFRKLDGGLSCLSLRF